MYDEGLGVTQDEEEALKWYRRAAKRGSDASKNWMIEYNNRQLLELIKRAVKGDAQSQYYLGLKFLNGDEFEKNYTEAVAWFREAAEQGFPSAQLQLGLMYSRTEWIEQDYNEAAKWHRKAAEQGISAAQYNIGMMYMKGLSVKEDNVKAYMWLSIAAASNVDNYASIRARLEMLRRQLSKKQINDADRLVRLWQLKQHNAISLR